MLTEPIHDDRHSKQNAYVLSRINDLFEIKCVRIESHQRLECKVKFLSTDDVFMTDNLSIEECDTQGALNRKEYAMKMARSIASR